MENEATNETVRDEAIRIIRAALRERTGRAWSVKGGRGTAWGWITIDAPPARKDGYTTNPADLSLLGLALGLEKIHQQGVSIPASHDYRREYIARARGQKPEVLGAPYWD
jgi:hypothetical protein